MEYGCFTCEHVEKETFYTISTLAAPSIKVETLICSKTGKAVAQWQGHVDVNALFVPDWCPLCSKHKTNMNIPGVMYGS